MTSCIGNEIEEAIERVSSKRLSLRKGLAAVYNGETDTEYHLRYILRCLGLKISGTKTDLISRIEGHGVKPGETIHDPSELGNMTTLQRLDSCPMYLLKVYLNRHGQPVSGYKSDLVARVRKHLTDNGTTLFPDTQDKKLIAEAIHAIDHGTTPSEDAIHVMEQHGYLYDPTYKTFFSVETHEKALGKNSILESIWFMTYPSFPKEKMELITFA